MPKTGDLDPEEGAYEGGEGNLSAPHMLGLWINGPGQVLAEQQGVGARTMRSSLFRRL